MTAHQRRMEKKREHEIIKNIRFRYEAGLPTTFAERNILFIYKKNMEKKRKLQLATN